MKLLHVHSIRSYNDSKPIDSKLFSVIIRIPRRPFLVSCFGANMEVFQYTVKLP